MNEEITTNSAEESAQNAPESAPKAKKKHFGTPFTSETAKKAAISAARAKKLRKEARHNILAKLTSDIDLGTEVLKAIKAHDDGYLAMIEKSIRLIGCHFDQSEESIQNIKVNAKTESKAKVDSTIHFVLDEAPIQE